MNREAPTFNFRHLRAFREVANTKSVSLASQRVYLSQPAITQAIAKLERTLGTTLFDRHSDGMFTTQAGSLFLDRVNRALDHLRTGSNEAARLGLKKNSRRQGNFDQLLTTTQLRALVAVSVAKNFSLAARTVGISQPSLHRAARDLERLLEITLFEKTSQGIDLTRAGTLLAQYAKLTFAELQQGFSEVAELQGLDTGQIVVGTMPLARSYILPCAINELTRLRPEVRINVVDGPYVDLLHGLRHGEIDMLIGALRLPPPVDDITQEPLFDDPLVVVARADHPLSSRKNIPLSEIAAYPWAVPRKGAPTREYFETMLASIDAPLPTGLIESSSLILIRGLLLESERLTLISEHQIRHEKHMGLAPLSIDMQGMKRPIGMTFRRNWRPTATQEIFIQYLRESCRREYGRPTI
jgi:LysR family transcriptional regulator, regulator for genes of the gallate degradation pathway